MKLKNAPPVVRLAVALVGLGLAYTVVAAVLNVEPSMTGYAVVIAIHALARTYRQREAPAQEPTNVVPFERR